MICAVIKGPSFEEAKQQIAQAEKCADLVELRLDLINDLALNATRKLMDECSLPMIFTLRSKQQGGNYHQSEEKYFTDLRALAELKPAYLDLESHLPLQFVEEIKSRYPEILIIISEHNFEDTPSDLEKIFIAMQKLPAHFYKIAVTAKTSLDALRLCCWAKHKSSNLIAISMGPYGQINRILAPVIGRPITYASLREGLESASGQLTVDTLLARYHIRSLNPQTALYGLIGDPVEQSISDETHNALMQELGFNAMYVKMIVKPDQLAEFFQLAKELPFRGLSVTIPLKESVLSHLDHIDPEALAIGAVNTLVFENGKISGFNTDGIGALNAIEQECQVKGKKIILLGAGGAAKAIAFEAKKRNGILTILNRDKKRAQQLANHLGCRAKGLDELPSCVEEGYDILINSTPLPMPVEEKLIISNTLVMEIKTKPKESAFLTSAKAKGCKVIYGYRMFVEQAVSQFALWFKNKINPQECMQILEIASEKILDKAK